MADRPLLNLVRAKHLLINLVWAGCRLLNLIREIRRLVKLKLFTDRSRHVEPCPGRAAYSTFLDRLSPAQKLVQTRCRLLSRVHVRQRLLNLDRVGHRLLTRAGHRLHTYVF